MGLNNTAAVPQSQLVVSHAIATVAKTIDEKILALPGSRDRLLPAISHAIANYEQAIAAIPGPIAVTTSRHGQEPALAKLFPSADDIAIGLGRSIAVRNSINWFVENGHERVFAVMGTRVRPGSPAHALTDHTFRSLAASAADARECLCEAAFTSLLNAFVTRLKERQREWRIMHSEHGQGETRSTALATPANGPSPQQQEVFARHLDPAAPELTAEDTLAALIDWLRAPEGQLRVSTADGQSPSLPGVSGNGALSLPLMSSTDRRHWLVCLTEFPLQEALAAMGQYPQPNRYILI